MKIILDFKGDLDVVAADTIADYISNQMSKHFSDIIKSVYIIDGDTLISKRDI